jgi:hypothetical protein
VGHTTFGSRAHGANGHDVDFVDHPLEGHVRRAANDDVRGIIGHQREQLVVAHVLGHLLKGVVGRAVHHDHLATVDHRQTQAER